MDRQNEIAPLKVQFRSKLIEQLKEAGIAEAQDSDADSASESETG